MTYDFNYDLTSVSNSFFQQIMNFRENIPKIQKILRHFNALKLTKLTFSNILQLIQDIVNLYEHNLSIQQDYSNVHKGEKALLLPHCARKYMDHRCKADFNPKTSTYECNHCSSDCLIHQATQMGKERGYDVYILPGGSSVQKIIEKHEYKGIIGVACPFEGKMAVEKLKAAGISCKALPLLKNGCSNTVFNLDTLKKLLIH